MKYPELRGPEQKAMPKSKTPAPPKKPAPPDFGPPRRLLPSNTSVSALPPMCEALKGTALFNFLEHARVKLRPKWCSILERLIWYWHHSIPVPWDLGLRIAPKYWISHISQREMRYQLHKMTHVGPGREVSLPELQKVVRVQADRHPCKQKQKGRQT